MSENWRNVDGYGGRYQVSDRGRVRSVFVTKWSKDWHGDPCVTPHRPRILQPSRGGTVSLYDGMGNRRTASVATLVESAFHRGLFG